MNVQYRPETFEYRSDAARAERNRRACAAHVAAMFLHHFDHAPDEMKTQFLPVLHRDHFREAFMAAQEAEKLRQQVEYDRVMDKIVEVNSVFALDGRISIKMIMAYVSLSYDVPVIHIMGVRRKTSHVRARHIVFWLARALTTKSCSEIGRTIGNRDHTTVLHAIDRIDEIRSDDPDFRGRLDRDVEKIREMATRGEAA